MLDADVREISVDVNFPAYEKTSLSVVDNDGDMRLREEL